MKKSVALVSTGYNEFDGIYRLGGSDEVANGSFLELDDATHLATLCGADPTNQVFFLCQENTIAPERGTSDLDNEILPGHLLKLFNLEVGKHIETSEADAGLKVGDKVYPANGKLVKTKPAGAKKELVVREVKHYSGVVSYRCEILA